MHRSAIDPAPVLAVWQWLFLAGAGLGLAGVFGSQFAESTQVRRRGFWLGWLTAAVSAAVAVSPRGPSAVAATAVSCLLPAALGAYVRTPYLKIGARIVSFFPQDADGRVHPGPPDSYNGVTTPRKQWWFLVALAAFVAAAILELGWSWRTVAAAAFVSAVSAGTGAQDGRGGFPAARGQGLQAFLAMIASIPAYGIPVVGYVVGYRLGLQRRSADKTRQ